MRGKHCGAVHVRSVIVAAILLAIPATWAYSAEVDLRILGTWDGLHAPSDLCVAGTFAYVANGRFELQIIDISDPAHPVQAGAGPAATGVDVVGGYLYAATGRDGLHIYDIRNPTAPVRVGSCPSIKPSTECVCYPLRVQVEAGRAYLTYSYYRPEDDSEWCGMEVVDVSNPSRPVALGGYDEEPDPGDYGPLYCFCLDVKDRFAYVGSEDGFFQIIDARQPSAPFPVYQADCVVIDGVAVAGHYAYVSAIAAMALDIADPANPVERVIDLYGARLCVAGDYLCGFGGDGLSVWDIRNPLDPVLAGQHPVPFHGLSSWLDAGDRLVCLTADQSLYVVDIDALPDVNPPASIVYVDKDATGASTGTSWGDAFTRIQDGIDAAAAMSSPGGDVEVWVAEGRYDEARFVMMMGGHGQNVGALQLWPGVAVYGGFAGVETARDSRDWLAHETIIDGSRSRGGLPVYHVVMGADDAILDGFTITGGNASLANTDEESGGGMLNRFCSPIVANCTFLRNKAYYGGGGIANKSASPRILNCRFYGNDGGAHAGGVYNDQSSPEIVNCLFVGNEADEGGAMICRQPAAPRVVNCTFVANQALIGGALFSLLGTEVVNSILWANKATMRLGDQVYDAGEAATFSYCSIEGGINGSGFGGKPVIDAGHNLAEDPMFVRMPDPGPDETWGTTDDDYGDLCLTPGSPLVDKGNSAALPADVTTDVAHHARIMGVAVEIGAYEVSSPIDLWAVELLRGWDELADGAAVEPGEAIRIRAHTLTANPYLDMVATFGNGDTTVVLELDAGGMAYEGAWHPLNAGAPLDGRIDITVCAAECNDCPPGRCIAKWVTMTGLTDKADLLGNDLSISVPPGDWGGAMQVDFAILNRGVLTAQATQAGFYLSRDSVIMPDSDVPLGQIEIPALGATGLHADKAVLCLPAALPDGFNLHGTYYVGMVADATAQVTEDFEHNNMNRGVGIDLALVTLGPNDTSGPMVAGCTPLATPAPFDHLDITFSETVRWNTFSLADITLLDPQGREIPVSDPELLEGTTFRIHFATQAAYGEYRLLIGPWIEDASGNPMNQNGNTVNGEGADDRFDTTIDLFDDTPPYIETMTVQNRGVGSVAYIDLTFSEAIDPGSLTVDDIGIIGYDSETPDQYYASGIEALSGTEFRVHTRYKDRGQERPLDRIQAYEITVGPDVQDMLGNAMDQRVQAGMTRQYVARFPVCSGFAAALSSLNTGETAMVLLKMAVADALRAALGDVPLPDGLDLTEVIGGVPLTRTEFLPGTERAEFFRITGGGAITAGLGFSAEAAGVTPSFGAHLKRDLAKVEQGLVVEVTSPSAGASTYKVASALTAECGVLPVTLSGQAETFLEFPGDLDEFTLGYTFSLAAGISMLGELESEIEVDVEFFDIEAGFMLFAEGGVGLDVPVTLSVTLSPSEFVTAMDAHDLPSAIDRYIAECALSAWPGTAGEGNVFGLVAQALAMVDYWNLSAAVDASLEGAMGSKAGLGLGFETPFEIGELGVEARLSASAGVRGSVNLFQWTLTIPVRPALGESMSPQARDGE